MGNDRRTATDTATTDSAAVERIRAHFADELARATLQMSPFPHLVLPDALPADVFAQVLADNPFSTDPGIAFGTTPGMMRVKYAHSFDKRFDIGLDPASAAPAPVWDAVAEAFGDGTWLYEVLAERFPAYFSIRFGDALAVPGFWNRLRRQIFLQRHEPGFSLAAHTDIPTRVASLIFSFADREGFDHCGTQLLAPKDPLLRCWGNDHHPVDAFDVVTVAPYRPNSCLVFFKTRHSFHSVSPEAATAPNGRFGMQVQVFEQPDGALVDLSAPDLMKNTQIRPPRLRWARRGVRKALDTVGRLRRLSTTAGRRSGRRPRS